MRKKFHVVKTPSQAVGYIVLGKGTYGLGSETEVEISDIEEFERCKRLGYIVEIKDDQS